MRRNLSRSLRVPIATTGIVGTPQMVFINPMMTTHVNKIANQPLMILMVVGKYINMYKCWKSRKRILRTSIVTTGIPNNKNGHSLRPNGVAFKYLDFKKC
jgi:hypothetical protein